MVLVRPSQVPLYLKAGTFFQGLDVSNDEEIEVPDRVLKMDLQILDELEHQLQSLRFWGVLDIPYEVLDFVLVRQNKIGYACADFT